MNVRTFSTFSLSGVHARVRAPRGGRRRKLDEDEKKKKKKSAAFFRNDAE